MDGLDPMRFVLAFAFVLGLIGLMGAAMKRYGKARGLIGGEGKGRLGVVEIRPLDARRRLVLVRRDDTEHLLLLADGRELVIESGIRPAMMAQKELP